jgi:hypothetical protein
VSALNSAREKNVFLLDKIIYDSNMNSRKVVIENAFGYVKNRWRILKHFDKTSLITIVCCVFHNYCEM